MEEVILLTDAAVERLERTYDTSDSKGKKHKTPQKRKVPAKKLEDGLKELEEVGRKFERFNCIQEVG